MRRTQLIKRRKVSGFLFFIAFSLVGVEMGFDVKDGLIARDFSAFLEKKLDTIFVDKDVRVSRVESSGLRKFAIEGLKVSQKKDKDDSLQADAGAPFIFSVDKVIIKYSPLNLLLKRFEDLGRVYLISPILCLNPARTDKDFALPRRASSYLSGSSAYHGEPIRLSMLNGSITLRGREPFLKNLGGSVLFYDYGLRFNNLRGTFLNLPVLLNGRIENVLDAPSAKISFVVEDKYYKIKCAFQSLGYEGDGLIRGRIRLFDKFNVAFKGRINIASGNAIKVKKLIVKLPLQADAGFNISGEVNFSDGTSSFIVIPRAEFLSKQINEERIGFARVTSSTDKENGLSISAKLNHISFFEYDVLSQVDINTGIYKEAGLSNILKGSLKTQTLIVNYKPFHEIESSWALKKDTLFITNIGLGNEYRLFGKVKLNKPYDVDLNLSINNADFADWLVFANSRQPAAASGLISGKVNVRGPITKPVSEGRINITDGNINEIKFQAINFNVKGKGPILAVSDSRIHKAGGFLYMDGEIDLTKLGKRNIFEDIRIRTDQKVIVWEGWDITKDTNEINAKKDLGDAFDVNFKTYKDTGSIIDEEKSKNEIGFDYKIKKDDSINLRMKDDSAFVGVEHKVKF